jgi:hypothetical protein
MNISYFFHKLLTPIKQWRDKQHSWKTIVLRLLVLVLVFTLAGTEHYCRVRAEEGAEYARQQELLAQELEKNKGVSEELIRNKGYWDSYGYTNYTINMKVGIGKDTNGSVIVSKYDYSQDTNTIADLQIQVVNGDIVEIKKRSGVEYVLMNPDENIFFQSVNRLYAIIQDILGGKVNQTIIDIVRTYEKSTSFVEGNPVPSVTFPEDHQSRSGFLHVYADFGGWGNPYNHYIFYRKCCRLCRQGI